jgi:UDP-N-acetyl-D-glucosamine dehydrogenase
MTEARRPPAAAGFLDRLAARDVTIGVIGLGYTGLPLALASARAGFRTLGHDTNPELCDHLNRGISHIGDVGDGLLRAMRSAGRFGASPEGLSPAPDVVFLCVPTPFDQMPDLTYVRAAARTVAGMLRPGMVIVAQSTSYPGTTTEVIQPLLEESGLRAGPDFALAFSPERIDPGNGTWNINTTPRLIGGVTQECTRLAGAALGAILGDAGLVRPVRSPAVAEFAKLLENSYRLVNIGLVNELTMVAHEMGIDIEEVIRAAATKPYGFQAFYPGVGPGGACIPEDPLYLAWKARTLDIDTRLIHLAAEANQGMARYVFTRILEMMSRRGGGLGGCRVLCIGAGYKPDVADTRHSRALHVMQLLAAAGARVEYADRLIPAVEIAGHEYKSVTLDVASPADYGLVAVLVSRRGLDLDRFITAGVPVFDAAHALTRHAEGTVERLLARWANTPRGGSHRYFHDPEAFSAIMTDRASGSRTAGLGGGRPRAVSCRRRLGR